MTLALLGAPPGQRPSVRLKPDTPHGVGPPVRPAPDATHGAGPEVRPSLDFAQGAPSQGRGVKPGTTPEARSGRVVDDRAPRMVRVAAASDLKFVLDDIVARLARRGPPIRIEPVYGSSGAFHAQLVQRAPFDLYLSADIEHPRDLVGRGLADGRDLFTYAVGRLVVWIPRASPLPIERDGIRVLLAARRIAVANPRHAPYGRAAEAAMRTAGIWEAVHSRLVLGETVAQAAQFVQSRAADAGLIARSLAVAPPMRGAGRYWDVPAAHHPPILQGGLVLRKAVERDGAAEVRDFLQSDEGRRLLQSSGFDLPRGDEGSGGLEAARTEASDRASPATNGRRPAQSPRGHAD